MQGCARVACHVVQLVPVCIDTRMENWEQGSALPNAQAAALIFLMARKVPDSLETLSESGNRRA